MQTRHLILARSENDTTRRRHDNKIYKKKAWPENCVQWVGVVRFSRNFSFNFKWKENERKAKAITITKPIRFIALLLRFLILENTARKPSNCEKRKRKMFNKILFIIIYSNITIPKEKIFLWTICAFEFSYNLNTMRSSCCCNHPIVCFSFPFRLNRRFIHAVATVTTPWSLFSPKNTTWRTCERYIGWIALLRACCYSAAVPRRQDKWSTR